MNSDQLALAKKILAEFQTWFDQQTTNEIKRIEGHVLEICPNCLQPAPAGLFSNDDHNVLHCGCYSRSDDVQPMFTSQKDAYTPGEAEAQLAEDLAQESGQRLSDLK